jgi:hypothetical protein
LQNKKNCGEKKKIMNFHLFHELTYAEICSSRKIIDKSDGRGQGEQKDLQFITASLQLESLFL